MLSHFDTLGIEMGTLLVLAAVSALWGLMEGWLILRDARRGKGKTVSDGKTRIYNILSIFFSPILAAIITVIPGARVIGVRSIWLFGMGICVMALGMGLRAWSIAVLGKSFRTTIELDDGQEVVQDGPYRLIRHPSYAGLLLTCIGYGAALQNAVSFVIAVTFPAIALLYRIKQEEIALAAGMGAAYMKYKARTRKLIPGIW